MESRVFFLFGIVVLAYFGHFSRSDFYPFGSSLYDWFHPSVLWWCILVGLPGFLIGSAGVGGDGDGSCCGGWIIRLAFLFGGFVVWILAWVVVVALWFYYLNLIQYIKFSWLVAHIIVSYPPYLLRKKVFITQSAWTFTHQTSRCSNF